MDKIKAYITGIGRTKFGVLKESIPELAYEVMLKSLEDSGLSIDEIGAIYVANFAASLFQNQLHLNSVISGLIPKSNIPIIGIETACASASTALYQAILSLNRFENIMVLGVEKMTNGDKLSIQNNISAAGDRLLDQYQGLIFPASYALIAQQHMLQYGTTLDDLALVSLKNHQNANLNELAHFYNTKVDLEKIKNSPIICSPLRLFDCCPASDGAAAIIISRNKKTNRDIKIIASAMATDVISLSQRKNFTSFKAAKIAAKEAYKQARIKPSEIDVAEVHDCFTIAELIAMEDLGFIKEGGSKDMVREGRTTLQGDIPINTDGGLKADGHPIGATGAAEIIELVKQLRGEAEKRQIAGAEVGLAHNIGGTGGTALIHILRRE